MHDNCGHGDGVFTGATSAVFRRVLMVVIAINAGMFMVEMSAGLIYGSMALRADALDFLGDSITYAISLAVLRASARVRAWCALAKALSLALVALWVLSEALRGLVEPVVPLAQAMGTVGLLALGANVVSALLLLKWRHGDANVRSVWLCTRNDAIGNVAVVLAAAGVFGTGRAWPDLVVAIAMAALFVSSSVSIAVQARRELVHSRHSGH